MWKNGRKLKSSRREKWEELEMGLDVMANRKWMGGSIVIFIFLVYLACMCKTLDVLQYRL